MIPRHLLLIQFRFGARVTRPLSLVCVLGGGQVFGEVPRQDMEVRRKCVRCGTDNTPKWWTFRGTRATRLVGCMQFIFEAEDRCRHCRKGDVAIFISSHASPRDLVSRSLLTAPHPRSPRTPPQPLLVLFWFGCMLRRSCTNTMAHSVSGSFAHCGLRTTN